jgi:antirestriction protein ArdC
MFHEMAHSTGHQSRLNRKGITDPVKFGSDNYSKEELVAELTACFICNEIGLKPAVIENQTAYINSWIKVLKKDFDLIRHASIEAEKAYKFILDK